MPDHCTSCGAAVRWIKTAATGSLMPIDFVPVADGNIVIDDDLAVPLKKDLFDDPKYAGLPRYKSHFVTCPDRDKWRKKR